jgi:hypothetical protein
MCMKLENIFGNAIVCACCNLMIAIFCVGSNTAIAQSAGSNYKYKAVIDVVVEDTILWRDAHMEVSMFKNGVNSDRTLDVDIYKVPTINRLVTRIEIPLSTTVNYGKLLYEIKGKEGYLSPFELTVANNLFLFCDKDTVALHLYPRAGMRKLHFSGKNAGRYNCIWELNTKNETSQSQHDRLNDLAAAKKTEEYIRTAIFYRDSLFNAGIAITRARLNLLLKNFWKWIYGRILITNSAAVLNVMPNGMLKLQCISCVRRSGNCIPPAMPAGSKIQLRPSHTGWLLSFGRKWKCSTKCTT